MRFGVSTMLAALIKADGGLFGSMTPHVGPRHPPLTTKMAADGTQLVLLRSRENPSQMRWQRADHGEGGALPGPPAEAGRQVLREANRPGGLSLTRARLENPDVHALVAKGFLTVKPAPLHHLAEFHAEITAAGREWIERFDALARARAAGTQQSLFKGRRLGVRLAVLLALRKAEQLRLFGFGAPVHVHAHVAHNPGGHGTHLVVSHARHVEHHPNLPATRDTTGVVPAAAPGTPPTPSFSERAAEPAAGTTEPIIAPGELLEAQGVTVDLPEAVDDSTAHVRARRGKTYHELGSSPGEWRAADVEGFAETTNAKGEIIGMPVFDIPDGYDPVKTRFSADGPGDPACELCGTPIKNVCWIVNDKRKLSMMVGNKCVEAHTEALMPGTAKLATKTFTMRLKPEEIAPTNELVHEGVPATVAAARVRARLGAGERFDKANPPPTEEQHRFWEQTRARVLDIVRRRAAGEYLPRGDYDFAFGPGYDRHYASSQEPKPPSMLAQEIRERADIPAPGLRRKAEREGRDPWPAGWDASARAKLEELEGMSGWPAAGEVGLDLHAVRDAFFPHLLVRDLHHAVARRVAPDWAETGRSLHETRAAKRQEAVDKAERKVVVETHPTMARLAALGEKVSSATPWTDEEQAWVAHELSALPFHKRPKGDSRSRKIEALTVHHDAQVRLEPLRKARTVKNKPGLHLDPTVHRWVLDDPKAGKLVAAVVHAPLDHEAMAKAYEALWKHNPRQAAGALSHSMHAMHPDFPAPDPTSDSEANNRAPHGVAGAMRRMHAQGNLELWHQGFQNLAAHWAGDGADYAAKRKAHVDGEKSKQAELDAYEGQGVEPDAGTSLSKLRGKKVWLYHGTSDAFLDDIRQHGLRSGREVGKQSNFGSARNPHKIQNEVYLTSDSGRGPAGAWDYARLAASRHGGNPVVLRVLVDGDELSHDRDDADLRSGAVQYRVPRVEPHQVKEVHGERVAWGSDPMRKASPARFTVAQLHAAARPPPPSPSLPPSKHVRYHHPDTGEERTGQVVAGGAQGITVADHETGQTAKVHHGHYVVADAPPKPGRPSSAGGKAAGAAHEPRKLRADTRDADGRSLHDRLEDVGRRLPDYRATVAAHRRVHGSAAAGRAEAADEAERSTGPASQETEDYVRRHLGGDVGLDDLRAFRASRLFAEHASEHGDERAAAEHVSREVGAGRRAARAHYAVHVDPHGLDQDLVAQHGGKVTLHGPGRAVGFHREADRDAYVKAAKGAKVLPRGQHPQVGTEDVHDAEPMLDRHIAPSVVAAHRAGRRMGKSKPDDTEATRERRFTEHLGALSPKGRP